MAEEIGACVHHAGIPATAHCARCHKPLCAQCSLAKPEGAFCSDECHALLRGFTTPPRGPSRPAHIRTPPLPWHRRHDKAVKRGVGVGCLLILVSPFAMAIGGTAGAIVAGLGWLLFLLSLLAVLVLASWEIPYLLFQRARLHLLDLIVIVALLGNVIGLSIKWVDGEFRPRGAERIAAYGLPALLCVLWILGGSAWGVWVATMLKRESTWARLRLILAGILIPVAVLGCVAGSILAVFSLMWLNEHRPEGILGLALGAGTLSLSLWLLFRVSSLHAAAKREDTRQRAAAANRAMDEEAEEEGGGDGGPSEGARDREPGA